MTVPFSTLLFQRSRCSFEEQLSLFPQIELLLALKTMVEQFGSLYLEEYYESIEDKTLRILIQLFIDGRSPEDVTCFGLQYISKRRPGKTLLKDMIIVDGVHCMLSGFSLYDMRCSLHRLLDGDLFHPDTAAKIWMNRQQQK